MEPTEGFPALVVIGIEDEAGLYKVAEHLNTTNIKYRIFRDSDINNELTAIATCPLEKAQRKPLKDYKLLK